MKTVVFAVLSSFLLGYVDSITVLGIDFGSYTRCSYIKSGTGGDLNLVRDDTSKFKISSSIGLKNEKILLGNSANNLKLKSPTSVIAELNEFLTKYPEIDSQKIPNFGSGRSLLSILAVYFRFIKSKAEKSSSDSVLSAVVSVFYVHLF